MATLVSSPSAYVDPYPESYSALVDFAERGRALSDSWDNATRLGHCFLRLAEIAGTLRDMAIHQRAGCRCVPSTWRS